MPVSHFYVRRIPVYCSSDHWFHAIGKTAQTSENLLAPNIDLAPGYLRVSYRPFWAGSFYTFFPVFGDERPSHVTRLGINAHVVEL
jgi:hypothetical protein